MKLSAIFFIGAVLLLVTVPASASASANSNPGTAVAELLRQFRDQGAEHFSAERGRQLWLQGFQDRDGGSRRCATCHTAAPRQSGKHVNTGKRIKPLAPSVNPLRLQDIGKINKWFKRNCKWTLGRECTPQEKGDVLSWLNSL